jgi:hypothetical protein
MILWSSSSLSSPSSSDVAPLSATKSSSSMLEIAS